MRRSVIVILGATSIFLIFTIHSVFALIQLVFERGSADAVPRAELPAPGSPNKAHRPEIIPKIIHQTFKNETIPKNWQEPHQQCMDMHDDYTYYLWTDEKSREFIEKEYPWFIETYDAYPYTIQRADVIRYFVLAHYGGTYIDMDDGCNRRLDPLNAYPAWVHRTQPTGISNDAMGSVPNHPFWLLVTESLQTYAKNWGLPYVTVMYSTGPLFLSVMWKKWISSGKNIGDGADGGRVRVIRQEEFNKHPWSFFNTFAGSSWHRQDAALFLWVSENWLVLTAAALVVIGAVGLGAWCFWRGFARWRSGEMRHGRNRIKPRTGDLGWSLPWRRSRNKYVRIGRSDHV